MKLHITHIASPKIMAPLHPLLKKVLPERLVKASEDYSIGQYVLLYLLVGVSMGIVFVSFVAITRWLL